jgi:hypothetical protein
VWGEIITDDVTASLCSKISSLKIAAKLSAQLEAKEAFFRDYGEDQANCAKVNRWVCSSEAVGHTRRSEAGATND